MLTFAPGVFDFLAAALLLHSAAALSPQQSLSVEANPTSQRAIIQLIWPSCGDAERSGEIDPGEGPPCGLCLIQTEAQLLRGPGTQAPVSLEAENARQAMQDDVAVAQHMSNRLLQEPEPMSLVERIANTTSERKAAAATHVMERAIAEAGPATTAQVRANLQMELQRERAAMRDDLVEELEAEVEKQVEAQVKLRLEETSRWNPEEKRTLAALQTHSAARAYATSAALSVVTFVVEAVDEALSLGWKAHSSWRNLEAFLLATAMLLAVVIGFIACWGDVERLAVRKV
mmetsp:Transcript_29868/g.81988  ORF Transcript_29868/g.81988 Transcript_29868/m.81988 type:complete len:288 (-) Transcript_29868:88-951(-)